MVLCCVVLLEFIIKINGYTILYNSFSNDKEKKKDKIFPDILLNRRIKQIL